MVRIALIFGLLVFGAAAPAAADHGPQVFRTGPTFGAGVGVGNMFSSCDDDFDCGTVLESASAHAYAGGFLASSTALIGEAWGMIHRDSELTITHGLLVAGVQQWIAPRVWIKGGAGVARSSFRYDIEPILGIENHSELVPGGLAAAGVDLVQESGAAFSLELRAGAGLYDDSRSRVHKLALVGSLSWH